MRLTLLFLLVSFVICQEKWQVKTLKGAIVGKHVISRRGPEGYAFLGIPAAKSPTGDLRFKAPIEVDPWDGIIECTEYKNFCPQPKNKTRNLKVPINEDCLQLNVFASKKCLLKGNCPVVLYINGGARLYIGPPTAPPENVINNFANEERNVVLVNAPYRLGLLGWLHLAPGLKTTIDSNLPHRDTQFALQWVQREIKSFGGNPNKVTIFGHSSGASHVIEMVLSPPLHDLFQQVIAFSTVLSYPMKRYPTHNRDFSRKAATIAGCATADEKYDTESRVIEIENCFRKLSWERVFEIQLLMGDEVEEITGQWIDGPNGLFPKQYETLLRSGLPKKNYFLGTTAVEFKDSAILVNPDGTINTTLLNITCVYLAYEEKYENPEGFIKACYDFYNTVDRATDLADDKGFYYPAGMLADVFSQNGKVFFHSFDWPVKGARYHWSKPLVTPKHGEDIPYYLWGTYNNFTEKEFEVEKIYSGMIANFINYGDPTYSKEQKWKPWTKNGRNYFSIDFDENNKMPGMKGDYRKSAQEFFEVIVPREAGKALDHMDFPERHDCLSAYTMLKSVYSIWINKTLLLEKTWKATVEERNLWADHLDHMIQLSKEEVASSSFSWAWIAIGVIIVLACICIGLIIIRKCCKRSEYTEF